MASIRHVGRSLPTLIVYCCKTISFPIEKYPFIYVQHSNQGRVSSGNLITHRMPSGAFFTKPAVLSLLLRRTFAFHATGGQSRTNNMCLSHPSRYTFNV